MNKQVKARWLAALRSGKYTQGTGALKQEGSTGSEFCCLGVLCDISGLGIWRERVTMYSRIKEYIVTDEPELSILHPDVKTWAGLEAADPQVKPSTELQERYGFKIEVPSLATLNDRGASFSEIADLIEEQL